ncbi:kinesin-like protein KIN-4C [Juglans microcarpa x Juglans regia]|uniref:kinesin-like protein KIN-4C n=1 Tax=Juglans microcarpa x Juglans regia TaxID=2249226 RepID=UPI001B7E7117|nr:kinesin-like protein KIN-4C [Juglans microcarpa x Juglans regia]
MIACVSPADTNVKETINAQKYADRAHNSQSKAVINRDPMAAQEQRMRCSNISSTFDDGAQKLNILEAQVNIELPLPSQVSMAFIVLRD